MALPTVTAHRIEYKIEVPRTLNRGCALVPLDPFFVSGLAARAYLKNQPQPPEGFPAQQPAGSQPTPFVAGPRSSF